MKISCCQGAHTCPLYVEVKGVTGVAIVITQRFRDALQYMIDIHGEHRRKCTEIPYISHLLAAAAIVMENGESEDEVIAALLHDTAEDGGGQATLDEIQRRFGCQVARVVKHCSDTLDSEKPQWKPRKEAYLARLSEVDCPSVLLVSIADKIHNALSILRDYRVLGESLWERFNANGDETLWYYSSLLEIYKRNTPEHHRHLVDELDGAISEIVALRSDSPR